jgi:uncharacterized repeat protein (TIGR03803 family)
MRYISVLVLLIVSALTVASAQSTYTESILYNFGTSATEQGASTGLVIDAAGNLYGSEYTSDGSDIYKLTPGGVKSTFYAFTGGSDGSYPGWLTIDKSGNIYGPTGNGGLGYGTIFKISPTGAYSSVYQFGKNAGDGRTPSGPVTLDAAGNFYGVTSSGGGGFGTVYKITAAGKETVLYKFKGGRSGYGPSNNVIRDSQGNLYGIACATAQGCTGFEIFKVTTKGVESQLGRLHGVNEGSFIARNSLGNFYGYDFWDGPWEIDADGVYSSHGFGVGAEFKGRLMFSGGLLYGTSSGGGANANFDFYGDGTAFTYDPATGIGTVLYNFGGNPDDAALPFSGLIMDPAGNLYGVSELGGANDLGAVFKLTKQ